MRPRLAEPRRGRATPYVNDPQKFISSPCVGVVSFAVFSFRFLAFKFAYRNRKRFRS